MSTDFDCAGVFKIGTPMVPGEFLMLEETSWRTGSTGRGGTAKPQQQPNGDADIQEVALCRAEEHLQECELTILVHLTIFSALYAHFLSVWNV